MTLRHLTGAGEIDPFKEFAPLVDKTILEDVVFDDVDINFCLTELRVEDVLRILPSALHPSIPGMAVFLHYSVPAGPWGKFDLLLIGVLSRSGIKSRLLTTAAFTDNDEALEQLARVWGFPVRKADVKLRINYDRVRSTVEVDDRLLVDFEVNHPVSLTGAGSSVRYPQPFNVALRGGYLEFVQVDASYGFDRVARGRPQIALCDRALIAGLDARDSFPVSGTLAKAKMTLHPVRFVASTSVTAEDGGVTQIGG